MTTMRDVLIQKVKTTWMCLEFKAQPESCLGMEIADRLAANSKIGCRGGGLNSETSQSIVPLS